MKVQFQPLTQAEFGPYYERALGAFAQEVAKSRDLSAEAALVHAKQSFNELFPDGHVDAKDQTVVWIVSAGRSVGSLHYGIRRDRSVPYLYVWDIQIDAAERGKGFGRAALELLETRALALGYDCVRLHVFGHNHGARALYERLGYEIESIWMAKSLA